MGVNELDNRRDCADIIGSFFGVCLIPGEIMFPSIIMFFDNQSPFERKRSTTPHSQSSELRVLLLKARILVRLRSFFFGFFRTFLLSVLWSDFFLP